MRKVIGLLLVLSQGCYTIQQDPQRYWRVECGRVATVSSPALVNATSGQVQSMPLASGPVGPLSAQGPQMFAGPQGGPCGDGGPAAYPRRPAASLDGCSCDAIMSRLDRIEARLTGLPMPRAAHP